MGRSVPVSHISGQQAYLLTFSKIERFTGLECKKPSFCQLCYVRVL